MPSMYFSRYAPGADRWNRIDVLRAEWLASALGEFMEQLFRVQISLRIARLNRIHMPEQNKWFSATCNSDTLVAMSCEQDQSVRLHRLHSDQLEEPLVLVQWGPRNWLANLILVADWNNYKKSHKNRH